ncbi:MAG: hypothetical protein ACK50L_08400 [Bacteroidota bacterium]
MGLNHRGTKLLLYSKSIGVDFNKTITIGRQGLHLDKESLRNNLNSFNILEKDLEKVFSIESGFAEPFIKLLGATDVHSIDASNYESSTFVHDMNLPILESLKGKYSAVIDGGSLEHIFNFPVAIKNCMEMVKLGGHFIGITPANNFFGHGFFQFSPELFFRIFSAENGFKIEKLFFYNDKSGSSWFEVKDPNEVKKRVILSNTYPSNLFVLAKKMKDTEVFLKYPQQSDYENISWEGKQNFDQIKLNLRRISFGTKILNLMVQCRSFFKEIGNGNKDFFKKTNL